MNGDIIGWMLERWPFAVAVLLAFGLIFGGMLFDWGPAVIRPASAQNVSLQIASAKRDVTAQIATLEQKVQSISDKQDAQDRRDHADRLERLEQQLLWYRQQNCRSKGSARNYTWQKMSELRDRYRELAQLEWQMPACSDIGE